MHILLQDYFFQLEISSNVRRTKDNRYPISSMKILIKKGYSTVDVVFVQRLKNFILTVSMSS